MKWPLASIVVVLGCSSSTPHPIEPRAQPIATTAREHQAPPSRPLTVGAHVPAYGCLGTSATHDVVACVVGASGLGMGVPSTVTLAFAPLAPGIEAPDSIVLLDEPGDIAGPEQMLLEPKRRAEVERALAGFVGWQPVSTLEAGGRFATHDAQVEVTRNSREDASLEVRARGHTDLVDEVHEHALARYEVRIFETPGGFVLERAMGTAEEGTYTTTVDAWTCRGASCERIL